MKKKLASIVALSVFCLSASAEELYRKDSFDAFYIGAGFGGNLINNDDLFERCDAMYYAAGAAVAVDNSMRKLKNRSAKRPMASLVIGAGKTFFGGLYGGIECGIDFAKSKSNALEIDAAPQRVVTTNGVIKNNGISYNFGLRLGIADDELLFYVKPSVVVNTTTISDYSNVYFNILAPTVATNKSGYTKKNTAFAIAFGIERNICNNFSARLEWEYVLPVKLNAESQTRSGNNAMMQPQFKLEAKVKRINIRLLASYNIKW